MGVQWSIEWNCLLMAVQWPLSGVVCSWLCSGPLCELVIGKNYKKLNKMLFFYLIDETMSLKLCQ